MNLLLISEVQAEPTPPAFGGGFQAHIDSKRNPVVRRASLTAWSLLAQGFSLICPGVDVQAVHLPTLDTCYGIWGEYENLYHRRCKCPCAEATELAADKPPVTCEVDSSLEGETGIYDAATISASAVDKASASYICQQSSAKYPLELPAVRFGAQGKPEFTDCALQFSLAHSGNFAVALLSTRPCGVDIERVRPDIATRLRERVLLQEEQRLELDFFECWTKKECIGKLSGVGIDAHPSKLDTLDRRWFGHFHSECLSDSNGEAYILSTLCEKDSPLSILRLHQ